MVLATRLEMKTFIAATFTFIRSKICFKKKTWGGVKTLTIEIRFVMEDDIYHHVGSDGPPYQIA